MNSRTRVALALVLLLCAETRFRLAAGGTAASAKRPVTVRDLIGVRRILETSISPDGRYVAFVVAEADLSANVNVRTLFIAPSDGRQPPRPLLSDNSMSSLAWRNSNTSILFLSSRGGSSQIWETTLDGGSPQAVTRTASRLVRYTLHAASNTVAIVTEEPGSMNGDDNSGIVADDRLGGIEMARGRWTTSVQELRTVNGRGLESQSLVRLEPQEVVSAMAWSVDGSRIAMTVTMPPRQSGLPERSIDRLLVVSADGAQVKDVPIQPQRVVQLCWPGSNHQLAFHGFSRSRQDFQTLTLLDVSSGQPSTLLPADFDGSLYPWLTCSDDSPTVFFEAFGALRSERGLRAIAAGGPVRSLTPQGHFSSLSLDGDGTTAAAVVESPTEPPEVAVIDIAKQSVRKLTALNRNWEAISLSPASELKLTSANGTQFSAFVLLPPDHLRGTPLPLVVVLYAFSGEFFVDEYGNYPIQALAAAGFAVALVSIERPAHNPKEGLGPWVTGPLAQVEAAVDHLVVSKIADPAKVGIMGWSYGSFLTDYAITHSDRFRVSSSGDGGIFTLASYWLVAADTRAQFEAVIGGPPYGSSVHDWLRVSPAANAQHVKGPVLLEYAGTSFFGAEFYRALRRLGRPAEMVLYPGAPHVFLDGKPSHRLASITRNLDWFRFWLLDRRDPDPAKAAQYQRWEALRSSLGDETVPKAPRR